MPTTITKRYSDFDHLNTKLRKKFPTDLHDIVFPKKQITGNFSAETIAFRSRAFEQYLSHIFSLDNIRYSQEFLEFFYDEDFENGAILYLGQRYADAKVLLEKILPIQEKLFGSSHDFVIITLSMLVICYSKSGNLHRARKYADTAVMCLNSQNDSRFLVPLLNILVRICWEVGKNKHDLESRLLDLRTQGVDVDNAVTLEALLVSELE